jgi:hypothetical protein
MPIIILFYQSRWRAYTIYITDGKRIQGKQHFRSPVRALNYVNELDEQKDEKNGNQDQSCFSHL